VRYRQQVWHHDLRHTCAMVPLSKGVDPQSVRELPGHADTELTLGTCSRYLPGMGDRTVTAMESALG
jgi:site-specific recombinase XerD